MGVMTTTGLPRLLTKRRHQILRATRKGDARWRVRPSGRIFTDVIGTSRNRPSTYEMDQLIAMGLIVRSNTRVGEYDAWYYELTTDGVRALEQADCLVGVRVIDEGTTVTAYVADSPIESTDVLLAPTARPDVHVLARVSRVFAHSGGAWWGWIVDTYSTNYPLPRVTKEIAVAYLLGEAAEKNRGA
jgi:hypothetical protein